MSLLLELLWYGVMFLLKWVPILFAIWWGVQKIAATESELPVVELKEEVYDVSTWARVLW